MATSPKSNVKVVFGAMTIGKPGVEMTRVTTLEDTTAILDVFQKFGHAQVDTARIYGEGSSEEYLGEIDWKKRGLVMDTKLYPTNLRPSFFRQPYSHTPEDVRRGLLDSLKALKADKLELFYLHGPDRTTPIEDTLREVNKLYEEGYFKGFGISNYMTWEVARICEICEKNGWIKPTVYQGLYNVWHRAVEAELFPCLRNYGLSLYCFNPLAGGFLTGRYQRNATEFEEGSRFDPKRMQGQLHHNRYWDPLYFDALEIHSMLKKEKGDAVIIGASSTKHLEENLEDLDKGPLPADVVEALDAGWARVRGKELKFWH